MSINILIREFFKKRKIYIGILLYHLFAILNIVLIESELPYANPNFGGISAFEYFLEIQGGISGFLCVALLAFPSIAIGQMHIDNRHNGISLYTYLRYDSIDDYVCDKLKITSILSGLYILILQMSLLIVILIRFPLNLEAIYRNSSIFSSRDIFLASPLFYSLFVIFNSMLAGVFMGNLHTIVGTITNRRNLTIILPYVFVILLSEILSTIFFILNNSGIETYFLSRINFIEMAGGYISFDMSMVWVTIFWLLMILLEILLIKKLVKASIAKGEYFI